MLVSVITPTWNRHDLLLNRCIPSVEAQTYPDIEHIIVSDGPDPDLAAKLSKRLPTRPFYLEFAERDAGLGELPRPRGLELAQGELIAYMDVDNAYRPQDIERLVNALGDRDFSYSQMLRHYTNGHSDILGTLHPYYGGIDTSMVLHRRELLEKATWRVDYPVFGAPDWDLIDRWLQAGTTWSFVDEITVDYYMKA